MKWIATATGITALYFVASTAAVNAQPAAAQSAKEPLPPAAAGILAQMDKEIMVSKKKAAEALEKVLRDTTKKGDLAGAMAVKQSIDRLNEEMRVITSNKGRGRGGAEFVGRWQGPSWIAEVAPDGTIAMSDGSRGTWVSNGNSIEVNFNSGITHMLERTADGYTGTYGTGGQVVGQVKYTRLP